MYLHDGAIKRDTVIENFGSVKKFFDYLTRARNLIADVYIDNILTVSSLVTFSIDSGYLMANIDSRFGMKELVSFKDITITVRAANGEAILIESHTSGLSEAIPADDVDADLWFRIGSIYPFNELKYDVPPSRFNSMRTSNMPKIDYAALASIESGEGESGGSGEGGSTDEPGTGDNPGTGDDPGNTGNTEDPGNNTGNDPEDPGNTEEPGTDDPGTDDPGTDDPTTTKYTVSWDPSENFTLTPVGQYESDAPNEITIEDGSIFRFTVVGANFYEVILVYAGENELTPDGNGEYSVTVNNNNITISVEVV
jgi:hypothetical protein